MKAILVSFLSILCFISCNSKCENATKSKVQGVNESTKLQMFRLAYLEESTAPYYVVVIIKNKNTDEVKEICTEAPLLEGALHKELNKDYNHYFNLESSNTRYFEFSNDSALWNISYNMYTKEELINFEKTINIDSMLTVMKKEKHSGRHFTEGRKFQRMFAHIMFNYGIMMRRGCVAGNNCSMVLFDSTKIGSNYEKTDWNYY